MTVTPLILTLDEAPNIERALTRLRWAPRVVVLDSNSTDRTEEICRSFPNVEFVQRPFDSHANQWNFGLDLVGTEWCLSLDADYLVPAALSEEIEREVRAPRADGYFSRFVYSVRGRPLHTTIYPDRLVLFRTRAGRYEQDGHTQRLSLDGTTARLDNPIVHDDRKSLARWLRSQDRYAAQELEKLVRTSWRGLSWPDRLRRTGVVTPWLAPLYYLTLKGGYRDGWAGLDYAAQRSIAELVLSVKLFESKWQEGPGD